MQLKIKSVENQSPFDLVLMAYGDLGLSYKFILDNAIDNVTAAITINNSYVFESDLVADENVNNFLTNNGIFYTTAPKAITQTGGDFNGDFNIDFTNSFN